MTGTGPRVMICLVAGDAAAALDFYKAAFGAEEVMRWIDPEEGPNRGKIGHAEFRVGGQTFYIADGYGAMEAIGVKSPARLGGVPLTIWLQVDDLEAARDRAIAAGARLLEPVETMTVEEGRRCRIADPAGYVWTLVARTAMA